MSSFSNNIEITDDIIESVLSNRIFKTSDNLKRQFQKLQQQIYFLKQNRSEVFYQAIVEEYLQGQHKKLKHGVTDVRNHKVHAEIKRWDLFMQAIGQLMYYNWVDPKEELHVYFFGRTTSKDAKYIIDLLMEKSFVVHTFRDIEEGVVIYCHKTNLS